MIRLRRIAAFVILLPLLGAGCDWDAKLGLHQFPFFIGPPEDPARAALALKAGAGMALTIQPSFLGVSGSIADVLGSKEGVWTATVRGYDQAGETSIDWTRSASDGSEVASGNVRTDASAHAHAMLLPVFWKKGATDAGGDGLVWMSSDAYDELTAKGSTDWQLGLGGEAMLTAAAKAFAAFNAAVARISGQPVASATSPSAFRLHVIGESGAFPLRVDGGIEQVQVIRASDWFAEYVILKNPEDPLILKVNVNPVAVGALGAFSALGVDVSGLGYEITAVTP